MNDIQNNQNLSALISGNSLDKPELTSFPNERKDAIEFLRKHGFPTKKDEEWRFTNIRSLTNRTDKSDLPRMTNLEDVDGHGIKLKDAYHLPVPVSGSESPDLFAEFSQFTGCIVDLFGNGKEQENVKASFSKIILPDKDGFTALNTALFQDGLLIMVPDNFSVDKPIHLSMEKPLSGQSALDNKRLLIRLGKNSECSIILSSSGQHVDSFTNSVTEIFLDEGSRLNFNFVQIAGKSENQLTNTGISMESNSKLEVCCFSLGGRTIRNELTVNLNGEGAECDIKGLALGKNRSQIDNHTFINHIAPNCSSNQVFKEILSDHSHGIFDGLVNVSFDANLTNANQKNHALLLSNDAVSNSNPRLQINIDDVKCSHGSTTGQIDEDAIFYLRSRGISETNARFMLIEGFADEIVSTISDESLKDTLLQKIGLYLNEITTCE
ncbi:MAG: Fe-S cluster assembly protein SufD [Fidelibacterota bacterium]